MTLSSEDLRTQLGDIPEFLFKTRDTFYDYGSRQDAWVGKPGSQFWIDSSAGLSGPGGPWGYEPFRHIAETCGAYLAATVEHFRCLGLLLEKKGFFLTPEVIVRPTYESSMRVVWMLDNHATPRQRAARVFLETFHGLRKALNGYSSLWPDLANQLEASRKEIFEVDVPSFFEVDEVGFSDTIAVGKWRLAGERYPGPTTIARLLAKRSQISEQVAAGLYAVLSGYTHPNPVELQRRMIVVTSESGTTGRGFSVSADYLRRLISSAIAGYYQAFRLRSATWVGTRKSSSNGKNTQRRSFQRRFPGTTTNRLTTSWHPDLVMR